MADDALPPPLDDLLAQRRWVRALARRLVAGEDRADDVEQAAWLAAVERPPPHGASPRGWLAVVLRNAARKLGRAEGRRARHEAAARRPELAADAADDLVAQAELEQRVGRAVLDLDEPYRSTVLLRFHEDLAPAAIAARQGVPVDTVRTRLRRALEQLRARLERDHGDRRPAGAASIAGWSTHGDSGGRARAGPRAGGVSEAPAAYVPRPGVAVGGLAMTLAKKAALAAAALALLAGVAAVVRVVVVGRGGASGGDVAANAPPPRRPAVRAARAAADVNDPATATGRDGDAGPRPPPVDLDACDRDLDLHGVVVRPDGTPVAGASLAAVAYPWRRTATFLADRQDVAVAGPRTRTASDGTFRLRLARGASVSLRVAAPGLIDAERVGCQAGERVRIVLAEGVRLRIDAADAAGAPLAGLEFLVFDAGDVRPWTVHREVATDPRGTAVADGLPGGQTVWVRLLTDGVGDPGWATVKLPPSGDASVRIAIPASRTLRGRVTDAATGAPIAGAQVGMAWTLWHAAATGADGAYALSGWTAKSPRDVCAAAEGYVTGRAEVGGADVIDFALERGSTAAGRVVGADGAPVAGARLAAIGWLREDDQTRIARAGAESSADGAFVVAGLDARFVYRLLVEAEGRGRVVREVRAAAGSAATVALGDVVLPAPRAIEGRCVDAAGAPVTAVRVSITGPDVVRASPHDPWIAAESRWTDDLGRFRFPDVGPGRYDVRATTGTSEPVTETWVVAPDADLVGRDLVVDSGRTLVVRVTDDDGGPVAGAQVSVVAAGGSGEQSRSARTDGDGCARFDGVPQRAHAMAMAPGPGLLPASWRDVPSGAATLDVVLRAARELRVRLVDDAGRPLARAPVRLDVAGEPESYPTTDALGEFACLVPARTGATLTFEGVVDGAESGWTARLEHVVPDGTQVELRCTRVATDRTLRVRVVTPEGEPVAGATIRATQRLWARRPEATTAADGRATLDGLPARPLRVVVLGTAAWAGAAPQDVVPGGDEIVLRMRRGVAVTGVLVRTDGTPVGGDVALFRVRGTGGDQDEVAAGVAGEDGRFALLVAADETGPLRLVARAGADETSLVGTVGDVVPGAALRVPMQPRQRR